LYYIKNKLIDFRTIIPKIDDIENNITKLKSTISNFHTTIDGYIEKFKKIKNNIDIYFEIIKNIFNNYKNNRKNRNYEILNNVNNIVSNNEKITKNLENVINEEGIDEQFKKIKDIYEKMFFSKEIIINYRIDPQADSVQIFGGCFVKHNKENCKYKYGECDYELEETLDFKNKNKPKDGILQIKLIGIEKVTDMHCLFNECKSLISVPNIHQWDTHKIKDMSKMFTLCISLSYLPDISKWDTSNVTKFTEIFNN
jgi:surface protein